MKEHQKINYGNLEMIKDIWHFIKPNKTKFLIGTFLRATSDIVWLFPVWAISEIITFVANYQLGNNTSYVWHLMIIMALVSFYHFTGRDYCKYLIYQVAENASINARKQSIKHIYDLNMDWHEKENTGSKMQKIVKGGESLDRIIRMYVDLVIESSINLIAILVIMAWVNLYFVLILSFFFITYYYLSYKLTHKAVHQSHITNIQWENFNGIIFESINNISIVKSLSISENIFSFLLKISDNLMACIRKRIFYFRLRAGILNLYQEFFRLSIVSFTLWLIFQNKLEIGVLTMVLLYFGKIETAAYEFAETYNEFISSKIDMYRMKEILRMKPSIENAGTEKFDTNWQKFSFNNVSFAYHGRKILNNFSVEINKGEKIGIVGISGTGKSTLLKLILKLYQSNEGLILFDKTSLNDIKRKSYMKKIAVVPQETELFNLSLKENITLSPTEINEILLKKALEIAHINDFSHKLPNDINSLIGEKGIKLSGGEKQRVGIARAIYKNPEILLLDEATSHLDIESEKKIQVALHTFLQNLTAIVIAHRLSTIKNMDKIIVMDKGEVLEMGSFNELIKQQGAFYTMWEKQKF